MDTLNEFYINKKRKDDIKRKETVEIETKLAIMFLNSNRLFNISDIAHINHTEAGTRNHNFTPRKIFFDNIA